MKLVLCMRIRARFGQGLERLCGTGFMDKHEAEKEELYNCAYCIPLKGRVKKNLDKEGQSLVKFFERLC